MENPAGQVAATSLNEKLIDHLSREIESQTANIMTFRSRLHFSVFVGPLLVLSSLVIAFKGVPTGFVFNTRTAVAALILAVSYGAMGWISMAIESHSWNQCNVWRTAISDICSGSVGSITPDRLVFAHSLKRAYIFAYLSMLVAFIATVALVSGLSAPK